MECLHELNVKLQQKLLSGKESAEAVIERHDVQLDYEVLKALAKRVQPQLSEDKVKFY